ncbi:polysaccharide biosynthesis protein [Candidatus Daviesbacteria bacterium]|nr:polysaccharide biosynthesis protein [Candidatus Daviesbacteria bacterium]
MNKRKIIIVGAGVAGVELYDELKRRPSLGYEVVGFVDDDPKKQGKKIKGLPLLGNIRQLASIVHQYKIEEVLIAIPSAQGSQIREIVTQCQNAQVIFRIVPRILEIIQGKVHIGQVRPVNVEDLLGRALRQHEQAQIAPLIRGKTVLVTGAAGSIGSELCRQILQFNPKKLIMVDWWENGLFELDREFSQSASHISRESIIANIQDLPKVNWIFGKFRPQIVFHAAAFKHVPLMELHPEEAVKNNIWGTQVCARIAGEHKVDKFVFISTDKAVNPESVMGASKLFAELIVRELGRKYSTKYITVRFGNVLGSYGSVVPIFTKQIARGGPVTVTNADMVRYFMTITEAAQLVLQSAQLGKGSEVFILDMGEPVRILELARLMIRLAGFQPDDEIPIKIIGRRPGEKLVEELLTDQENAAKTTNDYIFISTNGINIDDGVLWHSFDRLKKLSDALNRPGILKELGAILPVFKKKP